MPGVAIHAPSRDNFHSCARRWIGASVRDRRNYLQLAMFEEEKTLRLRSVLVWEKGLPHVLCLYLLLRALLRGGHHHHHGRICSCSAHLAPTYLISRTPSKTKLH
eukprot:scaffold2476_cov193-Amphora_coffeaeformis.AAC.20